MVSIVAPRLPRLPIFKGKFIKPFRSPIQPDRVNVSKVSSSTILCSTDISRFCFDVAAATAGPMNSVSMVWRVSGWLRNVGTSQVNHLIPLHLFVIQMLDPDLYRFDLQSSTLPPGSNDLIQAFRVVSAWLHDPTVFQVSRFDFLCCFDLYRFNLDPAASMTLSNVSIRTFQSVCRWLRHSGAFQVSRSDFLRCFVTDTLDLDVYRSHLGPSVSPSTSNVSVLTLWTFQRVSGWLRHAGTFQVSQFDFMALADFCRCDFDSSASTVPCNESVRMFCGSDGWHR